MALVRRPSEPSVSRDSYGPLERRSAADAYIWVERHLLDMAIALFTTASLWPRFCRCSTKSW